MLGTRALQVFDSSVCVVRAVDRWTDFYKHESCGKCTPCREGTWWLKQILGRLEHGQGSEADLDKLVDFQIRQLYVGRKPESFAASDALLRQQEPASREGVRPCAASQPAPAAGPRA